MSNKPIYILIVLLALLVIWALVSTAVRGVLPVGAELANLALPIAAFAVFSFVLTIDRSRASAICLALIALSILCEAVLGALQLAGVMDSRHVNFSVTGNFVNPGPYGGYMAIGALLSLACILKSRPAGWRLVAAIVVGSVSAVMMLLSRSRAAWLAFALVGSLIVFFESRMFSRLKHKGLIVVAAAVLIVAAGYGAYRLKPDSARGRFHIWQMDCLVIAGHPLFGAGPGLEIGAFGDAQAEFYASCPRSVDKMKMASTAEYAFNEFLNAGMSCGVPGLVLALAVYVLALVILARRRSIFLWPMAALGLFGLFSYPLSQAATLLVFVLCLADAAAGEGLPARGRIAWGVAAAVVLAAISPAIVSRARTDIDRAEYTRLQKNDEFKSEMFARFYPTLKYRSSFLYFYALNEFAAGNVPHATELLEQAVPLDNEPMVHNLLGECHLQAGHPAQALECYLRAYHTAPTRVYPLLKIMELYKYCGHPDAAQMVREYALSLPVEREWTRTLEIRKKIKNYEL